MVSSSVKWTSYYCLCINKWLGYYIYYTSKQCLCAISIHHYYWFFKKNIIIIDIGRKLEEAWILPWMYHSLNASPKQMKRPTSENSANHVRREIKWSVDIKRLWENSTSLQISSLDMPSKNKPKWSNSIEKWSWGLNGEDNRFNRTCKFPIAVLVEAWRK